MSDSLIFNRKQECFNNSSCNMCCNIRLPLVTMERPAPIRGTWVMLRIGRKAVQSHKQKEPVYEENKICRVGCPCGDDRRSGSGARGGNTVPGSDSESRGIGWEAGQETGAGGAVAILL